MTLLRDTLRHSQFREGARDMGTVSLGIAAWGLVTGVAMVKGGIPVSLALLMTLTVFAGSMQLAVLPLISIGAPLWVTLVTGACVNLRFVIFGAQWRPYFMRYPLRQRLVLSYFCGDLNYVLFMKRFKTPRDDEGQIEYHAGGSAVSWFAWQIPSVIGILLADVIPTEWGLGFAGVLALLGMSYSLMSDRASAISAAVAGAAAVAAFSLPLRLNIVAAIAAAVCVGLLMERRWARPA